METVRVLTHSKSSVKSRFSHHSSYCFLWCNSSVYLKFEVIWASPLCCSGDVSRFVKEPGAFRSGSPNLQTSQLSFPSSLQSSVMKNSGSSSVPWGLPKVMSTCLPRRVCPTSGEPPHPQQTGKLAIPVASMPPATASHREPPPPPALCCPAGWAGLRLPQSLTSNAPGSLTFLASLVYLLN